MAEMEEKAKRLACELMQLHKNTLLIRFRFLARALDLLQLEPAENVTFACDGKKLYFGVLPVLQHYRNERNSTIRYYMHCILHCLFRHMYAKESYQGPCWNLACDITVENIINELEEPLLYVKRSELQQELICQLKQQFPTLTAEVLYHHFKKMNLPEEELYALGSVFQGDDHGGWRLVNEDLDNPSEEESEDVYNPGKGQKLDTEGMELLWAQISKKAISELDYLQQSQAENSDSMMQNLRQVNRDKYDYSLFLQKFFTLGEKMQINDEEFDYTFYTYGLNLYGNVPLVEPLEYKELKKIKEFVIVIDTSASVAGELAQAFVERTYNILLQNENFFSKINLHIIQCDDRVQNDVKITGREDVEHYVRNMEIHGLGGTDFRPAFDHVEQLIKTGEFTNLKGLIYFTDGEGTFPTQKPSYETAFVFLEHHFREPKVPAWAMKLVLMDYELEADM